MNNDTTGMVEVRIPRKKRKKAEKRFFGCKIIACHYGYSAFYGKTLYVYTLED